jgi:hypothetical protein
MFCSIKGVTSFLVLTIILIGLLIMNGNFLVYAQKEYEYIRQDFTGNEDYYLYSLSQSSLSIIQPLQYFPAAIPTPTLQTYSQQSPSPLSAQNVQLTQQQVTVEICSNGIDDDRDGIVDELACTRTQTTIQPQQQQIFPIPQCEVYTLTVEGTSNLAKAKENINTNTDLTFEISSVLNPYNGYTRYDDLVSGKLWIDKDSRNEKELNFHIKEITNDCKIIAYLDDNED